MGEHAIPVNPQGGFTDDGVACHEREHARASASGAKLWGNCPQALALSEQVPAADTVYTAEGTTAHALGEAKLRYRSGEITRVQYHERVQGLEIDPDMEDYTDGYRDFVLEAYNAALARTRDAKLFLEQRLDFSRWVPGGFGTGDAVIISDGKAEVIDLKYGKGVRVSAESNPQLRLYGLGCIDAFDYLYGIDTITMTIYQPRLDNISSETLMAAELLEWGQRAAKAADLALKAEADAMAGEHCDSGFCRARPICRAYRDYRLALAARDFKPAAKLTPEEISEALDAAKGLSAYVKSIEDYALKRALNGEKFPGYKVVEGRSVRKYGDTAAAEKALTGAGYTEQAIYKPRELITITAMEKMLGKKAFNEILGGCIIKPQGAPTLVPAEDKRPEYNSAQNDFKEDISK